MQPSFRDDCSNHKEAMHHDIPLKVFKKQNPLKSGNHTYMKS